MAIRTESTGGDAVVRTVGGMTLIAVSDHQGALDSNFSLDPNSIASPY